MALTYVKNIYGLLKIQVVLLLNFVAIAGTTKWAEFEEDMVVTPAKHNGGSRRNKKSRHTRRAKSTRATKRNR